jgi:hypothetical protein
MVPQINESTGDTTGLNAEIKNSFHQYVTTSLQRQNEEVATWETIFLYRLRQNKCSLHWVTRNEVCGWRPVIGPQAEKHVILDIWRVRQRQLSDGDGNNEHSAAASVTWRFPTTAGENAFRTSFHADLTCLSSKMDVTKSSDNNWHWLGAIWSPRAKG